LKDSKKPKMEPKDETDNAELDLSDRNAGKPKREWVKNVVYKDSDLFSPEKRFDMYCKRQLHGGNFATVSVAVPGSIFESCTTLRDTTLAVANLARFLAIFEVDEIILYSDTGDFATQPDSNEVTVDLNLIAGNLFQYMETPPYLRKFMFPTHPDFQFVDVLPPLGIQSHLKENDCIKFREGVVVKNTMVNVGFKQVCEVDKELEKNIRCTVHITTYQPPKIQGVVIDPLYPKEKDGVYWGYQTRVAKSFAEIWTECLFSGGYDYTIGITSDESDDKEADQIKLPEFRRLLIVFGNEKLQKGIDNSGLVEKDPKKIFNRTMSAVKGVQMEIKTTEALPIVLTGLRSSIKKNVVPRSITQLKKNLKIPK
jgi:predicted SPOUT superfamily RNA methylase MTH1